MSGDRGSASGKMVSGKFCKLEMCIRDRQYSFLTNGGAEAMEMAMKLARLATGGRWYISTVNAFHGKSMGAISLGGKGSYREDYIPMIQQVPVSYTHLHPLTVCAGGWKP